MSFPAVPKFVFAWLGFSLVITGFVPQSLYLYELRDSMYLIVGIILCAAGVVLYGRAKTHTWTWCLGWSSFTVMWSSFAIIPILGPLIAAWVLMADASASREWVKRVGTGIGIVFLLAGSVHAPGFLHYQARARQTEAKVGLGGIFEKASALRTERQSFAVSEISQLRYVPIGERHRYSFWYSVNGIPSVIPLPSGSRYTESPCDLMIPPTSVKVAASVTGFTAAAKGNIDRDDTCDEWSINDARELKNTLNDVAEFHP